MNGSFAEARIGREAGTTENQLVKQCLGGSEQSLGFVSSVLLPLAAGDGPFPARL